MEPWENVDIETLKLAMSVYGALWSRPERDQLVGIFERRAERGAVELALRAGYDPCEYLIYIHRSGDHGYRLGEVIKSADEKGCGGAIYQSTSPSEFQKMQRGLAIRHRYDGYDR